MKSKAGKLFSSYAQMNSLPLTDFYSFSGVESEPLTCYTQFLLFLCRPLFEQFEAVGFLAGGETG